MIDAKKHSDAMQMYAHDMHQALSRISALLHVEAGDGKRPTISLVNAIKAEADYVLSEIRERASK